jgi:OOP family OmpA-OmpF porin
VLGASGVTVSGADSAYKIYGGYQFNKNLAVEGAYVDQGSFTQKGTAAGRPFTIQTDIQGFMVTAVGTIPLGSFALFGKAGVIFENLSAKTTGPVTVTVNDGGALAIGVGARYDFNRSFGLQAEYNYFVTDTFGVSFAGLGVRYKF